MINKDREINKRLFYKFNVDDNMVYDTYPSWKGKDYSEFAGKGDSLWRTSVAYITYGDEDLLKGITQCFRKFDMINKKDKYWYQVSRSSNRYSEDDVSRDQTIMALTALKLRGQDKILKEITKHLPYKLSRRFNMTPTMWFWVKYLETDNKWYSGLYQTAQFIEHLVEIPITKMFRRFAGLHKKKPIEDLCNKNTLKYKIYDAVEYPSYGVHLASWLYYTSYKNTFISWLNKKLFSWEIEEDNYILQQLIGNDVKKEDIDSYRMMSNWRGSVRLNGDHYQLRYLDDSECEFNALDKDMMNTLYNWKNKIKG